MFLCVTPDSLSVALFAQTSNCRSARVELEPNILLWGRYEAAPAAGGPCFRSGISAAVAASREGGGGSAPAPAGGGDSGDAVAAWKAAVAQEEIHNHHLLVLVLLFEEEKHSTADGPEQLGGDAGAECGAAGRREAAVSAVPERVHATVGAEAAPGVWVRDAGELPVPGVRCGIQAQGLAQPALQGQEAHNQIFVLDWLLTTTDAEEPLEKKKNLRKRIKKWNIGKPYHHYYLCCLSEEYFRF